MKQILTALILGSLLWVPLARAEDGKATLKVTGMTCGECVKKVENALKKVEGVKTAQVDLDTGKAIVTGDPSKLKTDKLVAAVKQAGFTAQPATDKAPAKDSALYKCESCGKTYDKAASCCGASAKKVQ